MTTRLTEVGSSPRVWPRHCAVSLSGVDVAHHGRTATDHAGAFELGF